MRRLSLCLVVAAAGLATAPNALADGGPIFATQGGAGVASHAHPGIHYVALPDERGGTLLETLLRGAVYPGPRFAGSWGIPTIGNSYTAGGTGLSQDDRILVLASTSGPYAKRSKFLIVDLRHFKQTRTVALPGSFSFDALSPDASRMYLIQYTSAGDLSHYIVRDYDLRTDRLLPGKIVDRSEHEESMAGSAVSRATSANGRWVYTLYQKPSGELFIHALDTVGAAAHCIDLPEHRGSSDIVLSLRNGGRTLAAHWSSGRPWLDVAVGSWRISYPGGAFPWAWLGAGLGGGLALLSAAGLFLRRRRGEGIEERARQELGLA